MLYLVHHSFDDFRRLLGHQRRHRRRPDLPKFQMRESRHYQSLQTGSLAEALYLLNLLAFLRDMRGWN
jgi:hypothetical protein